MTDRVSQLVISGRQSQRRRQTDRQTDRPTERQRKRQTDTLTVQRYSKAERERERHNKKVIERLLMSIDSELSRYKEATNQLKE